MLQADPAHPFRVAHAFAGPEPSQPAATHPPRINQRVGSLAHILLTTGTTPAGTDRHQDDTWNAIPCVARATLAESRGSSSLRSRTPSGLRTFLFHNGPECAGT